MLQACLNGARVKAEHGSVPVTHSELAHDALAVARAGAHELHIHPRDNGGEETLAPEHVSRCLSAVRAAVPGMPVGVGTGAWINPRFGARLDHIRAWRALPDYASVNLNEDDAPETIGILLDAGVGIEAGIWNRQDAERFVSLATARQCLRILVEVTSEDPPCALAEYRAVMAVLEKHAPDLPILLHGQGASVWTMVGEAARRGFSTRVGFEDGLHLPDGNIAPHNAGLVAVAAQIINSPGI